MLDFLAYLEFERGLSRNTLDAYRSDLAQFGAHLERAGGDALSAGPDDLARFVALLASGDGERPPVKPATLQRKVACLRSFYRHLRRVELIAEDPTAELRAPREAWMMTGESVSLAASMIDWICSMLFTLKAARP